MAGGEDAGAGGGAFFHGIGEQRISRIGVGRVGEFALLGEGEVIEPVEQLVVEADAAVGVLCRVDVQIDHAGQDERIAAVDDREGGEGGGQRFVYAARHAVHADGVSADRADLGGGDAVADSAAKSKGFHVRG